MEAVANKSTLKGGEFLIKETSAEEVFIPEEFSEEQKMMAAATQDFIDKEITPNRDRIDNMEEGLMPSLMEKAGELGLLGVSVPEAYGGLGMNFNTGMLMADIIASSGSFSTAYGAHTGIGTLPILYYGTEEQKQKYIPKLATGEWKACYCLTEPDAGSDANSGKTKAKLSDDGKHYIINGQKMWISNAGFADLFIVFAKIDDDKNLTAFIVEKEYGGITMNDEERKLGIKGSSTRQVFFNDCKVPVENMLSERENGFKIAVNVLNVGRIKLGCGVINGCKSIASEATNYANERKQFGVSISSFGAIQTKLANMAAKTYAVESASYRAGQNIDDAIEALIGEGMDPSKAKLKALEQFSIECAIIKIHGSEVLDYCVDEGVQVYGGMGFSEEAPMARAYRDARITRIYEGTNEINRMLIVGMMLKRAMKGELDLLGPAMAVGKELTAIPSFEQPDLSAPLAEEKEVLKKLKKSALMVAGKAAETFGPKLNDEQEILMHIADMLIEIYAAESTILRTEKLMNLYGEDGSKLYQNMCKLYFHEAVQKIKNHGDEAVACFTEGDELKVMLMGMKRFTKSTPVNTRNLRRAIADVMIRENKFPYSLYS
ncbi:acyl-CoA dehydrogenase family protein [Marinoscillum furvescens]|uniref:Alkylation response protein AidB-like acyl-CoA dehydrogenase n=1 Tax=Marinoscillum furvescens DSM 4134 TaxID=1122208 RepID=A0A3D9L047_MARFU|nr:acyl-CoA dehydrogenase family protein [Marinoscillum furvescens]RED94364.1 alkylation response protein AidB-like acyl-CoA dehydrogenase [Marinoscillum furvescens DSM 4134]